MKTRNRVFHQTLIGDSGKAAVALSSPATSTDPSLIVPDRSVGLLQYGGNRQKNRGAKDKMI